MKQQTEIKIAPRINYITVDLCAIIKIRQRSLQDVMLISIKRSEHAKKLLLHSMLNPTKEQLKNKLGVKSGYRKQQAAHI